MIICAPIQTHNLLQAAEGSTKPTPPSSGPTTEPDVPTPLEAKTTEVPLPQPKSHFDFSALVPGKTAERITVGPVYFISGFLGTTLQCRGLESSETQPLV